MKQNDLKVSFCGDVARLSLSKAAALCITVVTTMLLSRLCTLEEYGTYSQLILTVNLAVVVFTMGLPNSLNYFLVRADSFAQRQKFLSNYYTLSVGLGIIMGVVLGMASPIIEFFYDNPSIRKFTYFLMLYPCALVVASGIENILVVYGKTNLLVGYRIVNSVFLLGIILAVQLFGLGFPGYIALFLFVCIVFAVAAYYISGKLCGEIHISWDKKMLQEIFAFSLPIGFASVIGTINVAVDKLLIGRLMDTETMAIYSNAARELPITIIAASVTAVLLPKITKLIKHNEHQKAVNLWKKAITMSLLILCPIIGCFFVYAEDVIVILYSRKYLPGINVFRAYDLLMVVRCTYFGMILSAFGETKKILHCSIIAFVLNLICNPLFYYCFGIIGPALATIITIIVTNIMQLIYSAKLINMNIFNIFPWRQAVQIALVNILFASFFGMVKLKCILLGYEEDVFLPILLSAVWLTIYYGLMQKQIMCEWQYMNRVGDELVI